jgi:hypothetical protein
MSEEPLTLAELQVAKDTLEVRAAALRQTLHELHRTSPDGWQAEFERVQAELITVVSGIGRLDKRIRTLVESQIINEEDDGGDV